MNAANYNPQYYYYAGADCCNFVSQCLYAGGLPMAGIWSATLNTNGKVTEDTNLSKSQIAWRYVPGFESYWGGNGYKVAKITSASQASAGNPIYYLKSDGNSSNHIMLIVGTNSAGQVLVNAHNNDAYRYPIDLSKKTYYTIDFTHSYSNVISYNESTHTISCSNCGTKKTEEHRFAAVVMSTDVTSICVICGYTK